MRQHDLSLWTIPIAGKKPTSLQIEEFMIEVISSRAVQPGERIPSHRTLAVLNKVNRNTTLRAYTKLISTGWLVHSKGSKATVAQQLPNENRLVINIPELLPIPVLSQKSISPRPTKTGKFGFLTVGISSLRPPYQIGKAAYAKRAYTANRPMERLTLSEAVKRHLQLRNFRLESRHLHIMRGRRECLISLFSLLANTGDLVISGAPLDLLVSDCIQRCGAEMMCIDMESTAFLDKLEDILEKKVIKLLYLRPNCSYPRGRSLDEATCGKLVHLAKKFSFYIIEEEDDHEFWWGKQPFRPLAQLDHDGFVVYCAALSRISPYLQHLRTVVAPAQLISLLKLQSENTFAFQDWNDEKAALSLLCTDELVIYSRKARLEKLKHLKSLIGILQLQLGGHISFERPESGTCVWVEFKVSINLPQLLQSLKLQDPRLNFEQHGSEIVNQNPGLRVEFGHFDEKFCKQTAARLRNLLKKKD
jgi:GntR family transcriptional regulator / MocR family aminotransferase